MIIYPVHLDLQRQTMTLKNYQTTRSKGFSLVELLILVAIIGILAGMSGLALMKWIPQANLKRAARTIVSMCQDAKINAIKRNRQVSLTCDDATQTCVTQVVSGETLREFNLANVQSNVRLLAPGGATTFSSRGRATADTITVSNNAGQLKIVIRTSGSVVTE